SAMGREARYGLAGKFLDEVEDTTETDPAGLLLSYLATVGVMIGPSPRMLLANTVHTARIWPVLTGETSKSRKGTANALVERIVLACEPGSEERMCAGFRSGEALIDAVADPAEGERAL